MSPYIPPLVCLNLFIFGQPIEPFTEERLGVAMLKPIRQCTNDLLSLQSVNGGVKANAEQDQRV